MGISNNGMLASVSIPFFETPLGFLKTFANILRKNKQGFHDRN
jgi:hypothetical protein